MNETELARAVETQQRVGEPVRRAADDGCSAVGRELPLRREQEVYERGSDGAKDGEQRPLEPTANPRGLDEHDGEHDGEGLHQHGPAADMRELVRQHALEVRGRDRADQTVLTASDEPRGPHPAENARGEPSAIR